LVIMGTERETLRASLASAERSSGKHERKWNKTRGLERRLYSEMLPSLLLGRCKLFAYTAWLTTDYLGVTARATADAIRRSAKRPYEATVLVDGLYGTALHRFSRAVRKAKARTSKVRGVRRDENDVLIRLADSVCGLVRASAEGNEWARATCVRLHRCGVLLELPQE
jgi:hypothetical protein